MERSPDRRATTHNVRQSLLGPLLDRPLQHRLAPGPPRRHGRPWRNLPAFHAELERAGYVTDAITYKSYWALWKALSSADETTEVQAVGGVNRAGAGVTAAPGRLPAR